MLTLILQCTVSVLMLLFGIIALGMARPVGFSTIKRETWILTGMAFVFSAADKSIQSVWGVWAFFAGAGTGVYDAYIRWAPALQHSRIFSMAGLGALLILLTVIRAAPHEWFFRLAAGVLLLGMLTGGLIGWFEGPKQAATHYSAVAVFEVFQLLLLLGALFAGFVAHTMDRHLWVCLAIYALHGAWNAVWLAALAWWSVPGAWYPRPWQIQAYAVLAHAAMILVAARRLSLARRGVPVPAPMEPLEPQPLSLMGWEK